MSERPDEAISDLETKARKNRMSSEWTVIDYLYHLEASLAELRDLIWWLEPNCPSIEKFLEQMRKEKKEDELEESHE